MWTAIFLGEIMRARKFHLLAQILFLSRAFTYVTELHDNTKEVLIGERHHKINVLVSYIVLSEIYAYLLLFAP